MEGFENGWGAGFPAQPQRRFRNIAQLTISLSSVLIVSLFGDSAENRDLDGHTLVIYTLK